MSARRVAVVTLSLLIVAPLAPQVASLALAESEILIEASALRPPVLETTVGERMTFVNRSGRMIHVDFVSDSGRHHVVQVPAQVWAIFHRPGLHSYEVHFSDPKAGPLRGRVDAVEDPRGRGELPTCDSITVMGVGIER